MVRRHDDAGSVQTVAIGSTFEEFAVSRTVKEHEALISALKSLEDVIDDPLFTTRLGKEFRYHEIGLAMTYESPEGRKAVLIP
jgi:hypothetical protein